MVIIFGIVFFILAKFGFPVITKMVNERTESIDKSLAMAEEARGELANLNKEQAELAPLVETFRTYQQTLNARDQAHALLGDPEMRELAQEEYDQALKDIPRLEREIQILLLPKDPNDEKNVILEIRAGIGGDEAALFGADLLRMYQRYAERHGYKMEYMNENTTEAGGVKEVVLNIIGRGAYSRLKFESGVHRVQRVPETESQGRIHTSAATVAVMPEAEDVEVEIDPKDLQIDTYRSGGAGGQHVNKTESAIRITHIPTGIVVQCQDERSQHKNKDKAMKVLKSRIYEHFLKEKESAEASARRSMVGSGDRSERIRTYNFPQGRVTDHRINMTLYRLEAFLDGDMDEMIDALILAERTAQLTGEAE